MAQVPATRYQSSGDVIDYTPGSAVTGGDVIVATNVRVGAGDRVDAGFGVKVDHTIVTEHNISGDVTTGIATGIDRIIDRPT